jgi:glycosyltransferase involved in cell wall biosynthesis
VLDALAQRKTVVATACGGIPEIIRDGETGRLVAPADPQAMADGIIEMLSRPAAARAMADGGRTMVKNNFSVNVMVDKNIEVYERVLRYG